MSQTGGRANASPLPHAGTVAVAPHSRPNGANRPERVAPVDAGAKTVPRPRDLERTVSPERQRRVATRVSARSLRRTPRSRDRHGVSAGRAVHLGLAPRDNHMTDQADALAPPARRRSRVHRSPAAREARKDRVRSAWISFAGRIVAQVVGATASVAWGWSSCSSTPRGPPARRCRGVGTGDGGPRPVGAGPVAIAVLPLDNFSGDAAHQHLADA